MGVEWKETSVPRTLPDQSEGSEKFLSTRRCFYSCILYIGRQRGVNGRRPFAPHSCEFAASRGFEIRGFAGYSAIAHRELGLRCSKE